MAQQDDTKKIETYKTQQKAFEKAVRQFEKHIRRKADGTFELAVASAHEANVDPEMFDQLKRSLEAGNQHIKAGNVRANEVRDTLDTA